MTGTLATRILYMEDEPGLARLLKKHLERPPHIDVFTKTVEAAGI